MRTLPPWRLGLFAVALTAFACIPSSPAAAKEAAPVDFQKDIRPILSNSCFACHGPDESTRESGLRLDLREGAIGETDSGSPAIIPGDAEASQMLARISSDSEYEQMPPPGVPQKRLTPEQIATIKAWIEQGAEYQTHWSFVAPVAVEPPAVKQADWVKNPIDHFILARLEKEGLAPSPEADKVTLIRRATYTLTGLPPTPAEIDAFLADGSEDAYEKLVDRLLASPAYGEHRARFWLDVARYGDTHGLHLDNYREIWPYRDWVIQAFNDNKPFDQFAIEQLAGDLLPEATLEQKIATGFVRCHVSTSEGGSIAEEVYVRNTIDRVETFGAAFLGLTTGCAACHDHKFDPITQKEFYSLFAFFNNSTENPLDGNKKDWGPVVSVLSDEAREQIAQLDAQIAAKQQQLTAHSQAAEATFAAWLAESQAAAAGAEALPMPEGLVAHFALDEGAGSVVRSSGPAGQEGKWVGTPQWIEGKSGTAVQFDKTATIELGAIGDFERTDSFSYGGWFYYDGNPSGGAIAKMNPAGGHRGWDIYMASGKVAVHIIHNWPQNALKITSKQPLPAGDWHHVFATYDGSSKAAGITLYFDGKPVEVDVNADTLSDTIKTEVPLRLGGRHNLQEVAGLRLDDVRVYNRLLDAASVGQIMGLDPIGELLRIAAADRTPQQTDALRQHYLQSVDTQYQALQKELSQIEANRAKVEKNGTATTLVMVEAAKPKPAYVLLRGEYADKGDEVPRVVPAFLPSMPEGAPRNRLGLAQWLVTPENPLFSRVTVNRMWQQHFGMGFVETSGDFGSQGALPTHPLLLDWLAVHFRESGWDVKALHKLIVTSATFRQSSRITPESYQRDPDNRLLARGPRYRLGAEAIRDTALAVSGLLVEKLGGPSVKPYQPPGVWEAVGYTSSNTRNYRQDHGDKLYRRSMYTFWKRTAPPPSMRVFDAPSRETCTVQRGRTNSPTAALTLMNDTQFVEAARHLAARAVAEGGDDLSSRLQFAFRLCTARLPSEKELEILTRNYEALYTTYQSDPAAAEKLLAMGESKRTATMDLAEHAAWTMVANMLLNLDETITKQ